MKFALVTSIHGCVHGRPPPLPASLTVSGARTSDGTGPFRDAVDHGPIRVASPRRGPIRFRLAAIASPSRTSSSIALRADRAGGRPRWLVPQLSIRCATTSIRSRPGNKFELKLYGREENRTVKLHGAVGVAAIGCNIHDQMVGFIKVVDTPYRGQERRRPVWRRVRDIPAGPRDVVKRLASVSARA